MAATPKPVRKAVIPVAGFGTRFLPATKATPKEMFPLVDKPVAQYAVEEAAAAGIEEIIFITGQAKRAIEDHFDKNFELEYLLEKKGKTELLASVREISDSMQFAYVRQKEMLGWGHAILQARNLVNDEPFALMMPDDVYTGSVPAIGELIDVFAKTNDPVVGVMEVPEADVTRYGILDVEDGSDGIMKVKDFIEKPTVDKAPSRFAAAGRYVLLPGVFDYLEKVQPGAGGEIQGTDGISAYAKDHPVRAATMRATRHDAGEKLGYLKAIVDLALEREELAEDLRTYLEERLKR